jgi:hypothetical protein
LIYPHEETVTVYRQEGERVVLGNQDILTVPELFPGWELPIAEHWLPIFTEAKTQAEYCALIEKIAGFTVSFGEENSLLVKLKSACAD